ncbi:putative tRNA pseudouridine synthase Pus10 isoform X2 [Neltuma alba]|uniref:putative tRNA pseudouridine synthase Pus10 isoform X2 n=1 Tax=Neltuma alba TaxID=207710 RepID=UPI0010A4EDE7|nr:putative tRNA pseudouridine synthase Pus10 isoform X2 [Prosopis alba]
MLDESEAASTVEGPRLKHVMPTAAHHLLSDVPEVAPSELYDTVQSLPTNAVKDLLSQEICARCIFRLFGVQGRIYSCSLLSSSTMSCIIGGSTDLDRDTMDSCFRKCENLSSSKEPKCDATLCSLCLGILQFRFSRDTRPLLKKNTPDAMAVLIADTVRKDGHQIDSFSLEVSVPPVILENENGIQSYMRTKYGAEPWFQEKLHFGRVSTKDALKFSIVYPLENLLGYKSSMNSFRIRLTYGHSNSSKEARKCSDGDKSCKRIRTGVDNRVGVAYDSMVSHSECSDSFKVESNPVGEKPYNSMLENESSESCGMVLEKVIEPCHFTVCCYRAPIYFGGRYLKYSRNVSQTRWIIDDERMGEASVEEIIGGNILQKCHGDSYKFHAAGREDIDVRMLGPGRPFLVEVQNARLVPSDLLVKNIEKLINNLENKLVSVKNLKLVGSHGWNLMREGEAEKQKQYAALVWISRPLNDEDLQSVSSLKDLKILQRTPIRVLHRRSPLEREKIIHWMTIETVAGSSQYFLLHLCTQAGTYIKEFVHGDLGRTQPSIGSILGCRAEILQLDVTNVKMDCFLPS